MHQGCGRHSLLKYILLNMCEGRDRYSLLGRQLILSKINSDILDKFVSKFSIEWVHIHLADVMRLEQGF